jgi:hypothetical protein
MGHRASQQTGQRGTGGKRNDTPRCQGIRAPNRYAEQKKSKDVQAVRALGLIK